MTLQGFIVQEMDTRGLSNADHSRIAGLKNPSSLHSWLIGERGIDWKTLRKILVFLNIQFFSDYQPPPGLRRWREARRG